MYPRIGYSLVLKEVGALMQTMYLVGVDMKLATCAIGGGDEAAYAQGIGVAESGDSMVGEFLLGTLTEENSFAMGAGR
jgi:SagB-type dehydrogenase family enzyme